MFDFFGKNEAPRMKEYKTIKTIEKKHDNLGGYSFQYADTEVSIVKDNTGKRYLRVYKKECIAEENGRPVTTISDDWHQSEMAGAFSYLKLQIPA